MKHGKTDNELIAEFMGLFSERETYRDYIFFGKKHTINYWYIKKGGIGVSEKFLRYDSDFNRLWNVINRIREVATHALDRKTWEMADKVLNSGVGNPIEYHYRNVLGFIKWYNSPKP